VQTELLKQPNELTGCDSHLSRMIAQKLKEMLKTDSVCTSTVWHTF